MGLRVGGLASGLDTAKLIEALMSVERLPLRNVEVRKSEIELRRDLFQDLSTRLVALRDAAGAIDNLSVGLTGPAATEEFLAYAATSSDESVLSATASTAASPGTTEIEVSALAQVARHVSSAFTSDTAAIAASGDTIDIVHGGVNPISITVGAAGASLRDLRDLINTDPNNGGEVRADVIFDGTGFRLLVTGTNPGIPNDVSLATTIPGESASKFLDKALSATASDAQLSVFGLPITRPSNSIDDLIPGVTLELTAQTAPGVPVRVQISRDNETIDSKIGDFVDAYNDIIDFLQTNARYDATSETAGLLIGDSTIRGIEQQLQRTIVSAYEFVGNPLTSLAQIGIKLQNDGHLELDSESLQSALTTDASAVRGLLSGDGVTDGAASALARIIDPIVDSDPNLGTLAIRNAGFDDRIDGLQSQIERLEARLEKREELLVLQFTRLETVLAQLQGQGNALSSFTSFLQQDR